MASAFSPAARVAAEGTDRDDSEEEGPGFSALPVVAYLPESGFVLGGYAVYHTRFAGQREGVPSSTFPLLAAGTTREELGVELTPQLYLGDDGEWWLDVDLTGRLRPEAQYFGLGNDTSLSAEETYRYRMLGLDTRILRRVWPHLFVGLSGRFTLQSVDGLQAQGLLETGRPDGVGRTRVVGLGPALVYDSRSTVRAPLSGSLLTLGIVSYGPWTGSQHRFTAFETDARRYFHLVGEHVIAARFVWQSTWGSVPFTHLPAVAGSGFLRGFVRGRFLDNHAVGAEVEYRFPIWERLSGAVFGGAGQVAPSPKQFRLEGFHVAAGLGLRFALVPEERLNLRLDVAASEERTVRPYFAPLEAF